MTKKTSGAPARRAFRVQWLGADGDLRLLRQEGRQVVAKADDMLLLLGLALAARLGRACRARERRHHRLGSLGSRFAAGLGSRFAAGLGFCGAFAARAV